MNIYHSYDAEGSVGLAGIDIVGSRQPIQRNHQRSAYKILTSCLEFSCCFIALYPTPATPRAPTTAAPTYVPNGRDQVSE